MYEQSQLSRRERQIMDIVYANGEASATDVLAGLPNAPSRASVRTMLRILEERGRLKHYKRGREFIYQPIQARKTAGRSAIKRVLSTFFDGSLEQAVAAHLSDSAAECSADELNRLAKLIRQANVKEKQS
jgi:BlaI family penicillinase repressor